MSELFGWPIVVVVLYIVLCVLSFFSPASEILLGLLLLSTFFNIIRTMTSGKKDDVDEDVPTGLEPGEAFSMLFTADGGVISAIFIAGSVCLVHASYRIYSQWTM